jgi:hypothetical protein
VSSILEDGNIATAARTRTPCCGMWNEGVSGRTSGSFGRSLCDAISGAMLDGRAGAFRVVEPCWGVFWAWAPVSCAVLHFATVDGAVIGGCEDGVPVVCFDGWLAYLSQSGLAEGCRGRYCVSGHGRVCLNSCGLEGVGVSPQGVAAMARLTPSLTLDVGLALMNWKPVITPDHGAMTRLTHR